MTLSQIRRLCSTQRVLSSGQSRLRGECGRGLPSHWGGGMGGHPQENFEILNPYLCILKHFCVFFLDTKGHSFA